MTWPTAPVAPRTMTSPPDVAALRAFVDRVAPHVDRVAIAVGAPGIEDTSERLRQLSDLVARCEAATQGAAPPVDVIPVDPWGAFTPALNALAAHASKQGCGLALFASVETTFSSETVAALRAQLVTHDALVVGAALPGHDFQAGRRPLGGRTAPWNTLALWRLDRLCLVGFPLVADGVHAGVEPADVLADRLAADAGVALHAHVVAEGEHHLLRLLGKLARRRECERLRLALDFG